MVASEPKLSTPTTTQAAQSTVQVSDDGSRHQSETFSYDDAGLKTRLQYLPAGFDAYTVDETERSYIVPGAATSTTLYDDHNRATEVLVHDASHVLLHHVTLTRDGDGRLLSEDVWLGGAGPFPALAEKMENVAPDRRAELEQLLTNAFVNRTFSSTTFDYDQNGRLLRKTARLGVLDEERTTYRYDGRDNPIEAITEGRRREMGIEDGTVLSREQPMLEHRTRFDYRYDPWGNWTERVTLMGIDTEKAFQRTAIDRRINTYY
jgi:YD repeat-containing protein